MIAFLISIESCEISFVLHHIPTCHVFQSIFFLLIFLFKEIEGNYLMSCSHISSGKCMFYFDTKKNPVAGLTASTDADAPNAPDYLSTGRLLCTECTDVRK